MPLSTIFVQKKRKVFYYFSLVIICYFSWGIETSMAQCVGGSGTDFVCGTNQKTLETQQGSAQYGFDPALQLFPAASNTNPLLGVCFACSDGSIEATAGALTDLSWGAVRLPGTANQGDLGRSPEDQGILLPTDPGGDGTIPMFSLPLPPFDSFTFTAPPVTP